MFLNQKRCGIFGRKCMHVICYHFSLCVATASHNDKYIVTISM